MQQLETTKGKSVVIPKIVKRYILIIWHKNLGWQCQSETFTTPESAIQNLLDRQNQYYNKDIEFYKCIEVDLEIPFVPKT